MAALLLAHGAKIGHKNVVGETALHQAVKSDSAGLVALMLAHGADINARVQGGKTPPASALASPLHGVGDAAIVRPAPPARGERIAPLWAASALAYFSLAM